MITGLNRLNTFVTRCNTSVQLFVSERVELTVFFVMILTPTDQRVNFSLINRLLTLRIYLLADCADCKVKKRAIFYLKLCTLPPESKLCRINAVAIWMATLVQKPINFMVMHHHSMFPARQAKRLGVHSIIYDIIVFRQHTTLVACCEMKVITEFEALIDEVRQFFTFNYNLSTVCSRIFWPKNARWSFFFIRRFYSVTWNKYNTMVLNFFEFSKVTEKVRKVFSGIKRYLGSMNSRFFLHFFSPLFVRRMAQIKNFAVFVPCEETGLCFLPKCRHQIPRTKFCQARS